MSMVRVISMKSWNTKAVVLRQVSRDFLMRGDMINGILGDVIAVGYRVVGSEVSEKRSHYYTKICPTL